MTFLKGGKRMVKCKPLKINMIPPMSELIQPVDYADAEMRVAALMLCHKLKVMMHSANYGRIYYPDKTVLIDHSSSVWQQCSKHYGRSYTMIRNLASITYKEQDNGFFRIVELNNFKTAKDIDILHGLAVKENYNEPRMFLSQNRNTATVNIYDKECAVPVVTVGMVVSSDTLTQIISSMKRCGINLGKTIKKYGEKHKAKTVII